MKYPANIWEISRILKERYNDFDHYNLKNPLDELLYIICSTKTNESLYKKTYNSLKRDFPDSESLACATPESIANSIALGGLSKQKAKAIIEIIAALVCKFGTPTLDPLKKMNDRSIEEFLTSLPSIGKKVARCVMMYSLNRNVFPVDTHCWRIAKRLGWVRKTYKDGRLTPKDMDRLQSKIPPNFRFSLHVNMISLGREFCKTRKPLCELCPIKNYCKKIGV